MNKEELQKGDLLLSRNLTIAKIFRAMNLAENAGFGFDKMFKGWRPYYKAEPQVLNEKLFYSITFPLNTKKREELNGGLNVLYEFIRNRGGAQLKDISNELNIPQRTIERSISKLINLGRIKRKGSKKTGGYFIKIINKKEVKNGK